MEGTLEHNFQTPLLLLLKHRGRGWEEGGQAECRKAFTYSYEKISATNVQLTSISPEERRVVHEEEEDIEEKEAEEAKDTANEFLSPSSTIHLQPLFARQQLP